MANSEVLELIDFIAEAHDRLETEVMFVDSYPQFSKLAPVRAYKSNLEKMKEHLQNYTEELAKVVQR